MWKIKSLKERGVTVVLRCLWGFTVSYTSVFFLSVLHIRTAPCTLEISQAALSHFQAASSILPLINKVNLFPQFIFMNPQATTLSGAPQYIFPANWRKALFIYQILTAGLLQESSYLSYFLPVALQWLQMGLSLSGLELMSGEMKLLRLDLTHMLECLEWWCMCVWLWQR